MPRFWSCDHGHALTVVRLRADFSAPVYFEWLFVNQGLSIDYTTNGNLEDPVQLPILHIQGWIPIWFLPPFEPTSSSRLSFYVYTFLLTNVWRSFFKLFCWREGVQESEGSIISPCDSDEADLFMNFSGIKDRVGQEVWKRASSSACWLRPLYFRAFQNITFQRKFNVNSGRHLDPLFPAGRRASLEIIPPHLTPNKARRCISLLTECRNQTCSKAPAAAYGSCVKRCHNSSLLETGKHA